MKHLSLLAFTALAIIFAACSADSPDPGTSGNGEQPARTDFNGFYWGTDRRAIIEELGNPDVRQGHKIGYTKKLGYHDMLAVFEFNAQGELITGIYTKLTSGSADAYVSLREELVKLYGEPVTDNPAEAVWLEDRSVIRIYLDGTKLGIVYISQEERRRQKASLSTDL